MRKDAFFVQKGLIWW